MTHGEEEVGGAALWQPSSYCVRLRGRARASNGSLTALQRLSNDSLTALYRRVLQVVRRYYVGERTIAGVGAEELMQVRWLAALQRRF